MMTPLPTLRPYQAADGSQEYAGFWREIELARVAYRPGQQMTFFVAPADGHDDYLASLALAVALREALPQPGGARASAHSELTGKRT